MLQINSVFVLRNQIILHETMYYSSFLKFSEMTAFFLVSLIISLLEMMWW